MHHHVLVDVEEALLRRRPCWPSTRPPIPPDTQCRECAKAILCWAWRCSRALHLLAFETPDKGPPGPPPSLLGTDCCADGWVPRLPDILLDTTDYLTAAVACRSVGDWATEASEWMTQHGDYDLERHMLLCDCEFVYMSTCFMEGMTGDWDREGTLISAADFVHRMTELFITPWD